jgi:hypothetical protein
MNASRDNLFAGTGFSRDEDRGIRFRDALSGFHETLHGPAMHNRRHTQQNLRFGIGRQKGANQESANNLLPETCESYKRLRLGRLR